MVGDNEECDAESEPKDIRPNLRKDVPPSQTDEDC